MRKQLLLNRWQGTLALDTLAGFDAEDNPHQARLEMVMLAPGMLMMLLQLALPALHYASYC